MTWLIEPIETTVPFCYRSTERPGHHYVAEEYYVQEHRQALYNLKYTMTARGKLILFSFEIGPI